MGLTDARRRLHDGPGRAAGRRAVLANRIIVAAILLSAGATMPETNPRSRRRPGRC